MRCLYYIILSAIMKDTNILTTVIIALIIVRIVDFSNLSILDIIILILFVVNIVLKIINGGKHEPKKNTH